MSEFYTSYKPSLPVPSYEDPFFCRDDNDKVIPDEQEKETMFRLADALLEVDKFIGNNGYSVITARDGQVEKIKMRYSAHDGEIEVAIYRNHIDFNIHRQYGIELEKVVDLCMLVSRKMVGYFAYWHYDMEPPYDPLDREDELPPIPIQIYEKWLTPNIPEKKKNPARWKFWGK